MKKRNIIYLVICLLTGIILGIIIDMNRHHIISGQYIRDHWHFRKKLDYNVTESQDLMVCFTFGQSNAGNYGDGSYIANEDILNYYEGNIYTAEEPLLGPDGNGTSVWTRVANSLLKEKLFKKILIVPIAVGGTSINRWLNGDCRKKLDKTLDQLEEDHIKVTHILWTQGETDNVDKTSAADYEHMLTELIKVFRKRNIQSPFFISKTSYFPYNNDNNFGIDNDIILAQTNVIKKNKNVFEGPNTDALNLAYYRKDAVHFTEKGLDALALEWVKKIKSIR